MEWFNAFDRGIRDIAQHECDSNKQGPLDRRRKLQGLQPLTANNDDRLVKKQKLPILQLRRRV
jgi:hypothetical protein